MTDQTERSEAKGKDLIGLFLCGIGGLFFVSVLLSFGERAPKDVVWTAPVVALIDVIGRGAALVLSGALAGIGTALFLGKRDFAVGRNLAGIAGVALGLSLLIGGVVPTGTEGGLLGSVLPDLLPGVAGRLSGAILGLGIAAASAYFTWLLPIAVAGAQSLAPSLEARGGSEGVSAAEAAALTPATPAAVPERVVEPSSPYPSDARLEGRIPRGTQPLDPGRTVAPSPAREERREDVTPLEKEGWQRVVPTRAEREEEARPPLGGGGPALVDVQPIETAGSSPLTPSWERSPTPVPSEPWDEPRVVPLATPAAETPPAPEARVQPPAVPVLEDAPPPEPQAEVEPEPAAEASGEAEPAAEASGEAEPAAEGSGEVEPAAEEQPQEEQAAAQKASPAAWEQVGLFDDQEPESPVASALEEQASEPVEVALEEDDEEEDEGEYEEEDEDEELVASDEDDEEEDEEEYEEEDEDEELVASDEDDEEEDEEEYEEEDEDEELVASDEDDEEEDEEEYEEEDEDEELVASDEDDEEEDEEEYEEEDEDEELVASDEDDEEGDEEKDEDEELVASDEGDEEEDEEELVASDQPEEDEAASPEVAEPEKVLEPAPAPAAEDPAPMAPAADFETLVRQAGCLVIEHNRVAVSMLQRSFQLDFDQACAVLDQLQERGLIGPYMGGRTRDILLTREEWLVQAPVA